MTDPANRQPVRVGAEPLPEQRPDRLGHLDDNRSLIVRRSLFATALGTLMPLPVLDELVAGRVRAGLLMKLAATRGVDLPPGPAALLADPRDSSTARKVTMTAAILLAFRFASRKAFVLLAAGRGADEMATSFQYATLFDHYCARLHVGGPLRQDQARKLRADLYASVTRAEKHALVAAFSDGGRIMGRSLLEAPRWLAQHLNAWITAFVQSRGAPGSADAPGIPDPDTDAIWLDRAGHAVEQRIASLGRGYLQRQVDDFETRWALEPVTDPTAGRQV